MIELSLINTPNQEFNAILNDQNCTIQVRFLGDNAYFSLWVDDNPIVQNVIMLPKEKILLYQSNFSGNFFIVDSTSPADNQSKPNYKELETRFKLYYLTDEEMQEIEND